jgi:histidyl-tRNA synthetase
MDKLQTLKGFRDFLPEQSRKRQYVIQTLKEVFESFEFEPIETPTLEYEEILMGKYGEEADKLLYHFTDNGDRRVAMRYDQTVPLARVVAQYQNELSFPFKRYQIQPVWRAENTQRGRYREFLQCDIDTVGSKGAVADAEILATVATAYNRLGFPGFRILVNDRRLFGDIGTDAIITIDKLKKIGPERVKEELRQKGYDEAVLDEIQNKQPTESLELILSLATQLGAPADQIVFEPTLARGLDYYTGFIFEVEIDGYTTGSVCGGGRYDNLIGMFAGRDIPAVGCAFGFDRTIDAMDEQQLFPQTIAKDILVLITIFSPAFASESVRLLNNLQEKKIAVTLYTDETAKMEKQVKFADNKNIPYVVILGPEEKDKNSVTVKNMKNREQLTIPIDELPAFLKAQ